MEGPFLNTDKELWRKDQDYYAPSIHVTKEGAIAINVGGLVIVRPVEDWHKLAAPTLKGQPMIEVTQEQQLTTYELAQQASTIAQGACGLHPQQAQPSSDQDIRAMVGSSALAAEVFKTLVRSHVNNKTERVHREFQERVASAQGLGAKNYPPFPVGPLGVGQI